MSKKNKRPIVEVDLTTPEKRKEYMQFGSMTDEEGGFKFWEDIEKFRDETLRSIPPNADYGMIVDHILRQGEGIKEM